jgi:hypothetical protein
LNYRIINDGVEKEEIPYYWKVKFNEKNEFEIDKFNYLVPEDINHTFIYLHSYKYSIHLSNDKLIFLMTSDLPYWLDINL